MIACWLLSSTASTISTEIIFRRKVIIDKMFSLRSIVIVLLSFGGPTNYIVERHGAHSTCSEEHF